MTLVKGVRKPAIPPVTAEEAARSELQRERKLRAAMFLSKLSAPPAASAPLPQLSSKRAASPIVASMVETQVHGASKRPRVDEAPVTEAAPPVLPVGAPSAASVVAAQVRRDSYLSTFLSESQRRRMIWASVLPG